MSTKNNPGQYNCYAKAEPDEPMFTLLGRDPCASFLIGIWVDVQKKLGVTDPAKLAEAMACSDDMNDWAMKKHGSEKMFAVIEAFAAVMVEYHPDAKMLAPEVIQAARTTDKEETAT